MNQSELSALSAKSFQSSREHVKKTYILHEQAFSKADTYTSMWNYASIYLIACDSEVCDRRQKGRIVSH